MTSVFQTRFRSVTVGILLAGTAACQTPVVLQPAPTVMAKAETDPVETIDDAADDPAIWRNAADPARSLIVGTDKKAGIHVHDLSGKRLGFTPSPRLNNVDLRDGVAINGRAGVLVAASDRADLANGKVALFVLDTAAARLDPLGAFASGAGEAYGMCLWQRASDEALFGFVVMKDGRIDQLAIDASGATPSVTPVRSLKLGTQAEGCVADDRTGILYVTEENVGIWRFDADPASSAQATEIARVDNANLYADVEGAALAPIGSDGGYLIVSSQGDNAYAAYRLPDLSYAGRFRIADGVVDGVSETDGIEVMLGDFGPDYPEGIFVAQDGDNAPATQNFKLVDWREVERALGIQ